MLKNLMDIYPTSTENIVETFVVQAIKARIQNTSHSTIELASIKEM